MAEHDPPEARPVETEIPSDLMTALVAGIEDAAATGKGLACQITALETNVDRAHRRRTGLIAAAALVALLVLGLGVEFLRLELASREDRRIQVECTTPSTPGDRHECYEDTLSRTGAAVGRVGETTVAAAQCVVDRDPDVQACVERALAP